jgi:hypothetical protein
MLSTDEYLSIKRENSPSDGLDCMTRDDDTGSSRKLSVSRRSPSKTSSRLEKKSSTEVFSLRYS